MKLKQYFTESKPSKKAITKAEAEAKEWSKDPDNQYGAAWVILDKGKLVVTANTSHYPKGKEISKWVDGYKEVQGIKMRYS
jgi:hypothetical protein